MAQSIHAVALPLLCWLSVAGLLPLASGRAFLGYDPKIQAAAFQEELQDMIVEALGEGHSIGLDRLNKINSTVAPIFSSLPKNQQGHITAPSMRHALHRYFGEVRGWIVRGFEPHGADTSDSSVGKILRSKLPEYAEAVIEREMSHGGFTLHDTVSAVVVVEQLIFDEALQAMNSAYSLNEHAVTEPVSRTDMLSILQSFAIVEMLEGNSSDVNQHKLDKHNIGKIYPHWDHTALFLDDMVNDDTYQHRHSSNPFAERHYHFEDAARIAQDFSQEFSRWSNHECEDIKDALVSVDPLATGRVRLADFYHLSEGGAWQFLESSAYLRQLGILDESSASLGPQVMIPNYVTGMSNCISSTPFYSACCWNECMGLQRSLEGYIRAPFASAAEILRAVEQISSSTQEARNLSLPLRARLDEVATFHGGKVPLHGRLFAQWFHFVFPRECAFPHVAGTVSPQTPGEFSLLLGEDALAAGAEEMHQHLNSEHAKVPISPEAGAAMWTLQEELIATHELSEYHFGRSIVRTSALLVMALSLVFFVTKHLTHLESFVSSGKKDCNEYTI